jgi:hypothetical protein
VLAQHAARAPLGHTRHALHMQGRQASARGAR